MEPTAILDPQAPPPCPVDEPQTVPAALLEEADQLPGLVDYSDGLVALHIDFAQPGIYDSVRLTWPAADAPPHDVLLSFVASLGAQPRCGLTELAETIRGTATFAPTEPVDPDRLAQVGEYAPHSDHPLPRPGQS